ncbi:MAG: LysR family transcriptional regulator [Polyangiaceae bacterium]
MNIAALDLNLLVALEALLAEKNVTRASRRLGLSQPATSHALSRLRDVFADPLLVRTPRGMQPTTRATELAPLLHDALAAVRRTLESPKAFSPAESERTFNVLMADQGSFLILPGLLDAIRREAPRVSVAVRPLSLRDVEQPLADGTLDLVVGPFAEDRPGLRRQRLIHERFVCVMRKGSGAARGKLTLARYCELSHLLVSPSGEPGSFIDNRLAELGRRRHVALYVPQFLVAPHGVAQTELVWTAPERIARTYAATLPLVLRPVPLGVDGFVVSQVWHERVERDPAHRWFRETVAQVAQAQG